MNYFFLWFCMCIFHCTWGLLILNWWKLMDSQMTSVFTLTNTFTVNWCILLFFLQNAFVQLSLAFRNDNYTLESRLKQTERERTLTEENTEKELEEFKSSLKVRPECKQPTQTHMLGINWNVTNCCWRLISEHCVTVAERRAAEFYQQLLETIAVLHRLTNRLSSRAEMLGAVRQVRCSSPVNH